MAKLILANQFLWCFFAYACTSTVVSMCLRSSAPHSVHTLLPLSIHHRSVCFLTSWTLEAGLPARSREWPRAPLNVASRTESCSRCCPRSTTAWFLRPWLILVEGERWLHRARTNFSVRADVRSPRSDGGREGFLSALCSLALLLRPPPLPLRPTQHCCITLESWTLLVQKRLQLCSTFRGRSLISAGRPRHLPHCFVKDPSLNTKKVFSHFCSELPKW